MKELRAGWDEAARSDPFYHILTEADKENGGWDRKAFFERGQRDVAQLLDGLKGAGFKPKYGVALDFGCGVGRCTQALARYFRTAYGVDISPRMVRLARRYDKRKRCVFRVNGSPRLRAFADRSCDFVYSQFVLQHMEASLQVGYLREFVRVLRPKGVAAFVVADNNFPMVDAPWRGIYALHQVEARINEIDETLEVSSVVTENGHFWVVRK